MIKGTDLNKKIVIQSKEEVSNDYGYPEFTFKDVLKNVSAEVTTISTRDRESNAFPYTEYTLRFLIRSRDIIDDKKFIYYKGERYNIKHIHEFKDCLQDYMKITGCRAD